MENSLVINILNIVEDKLRELNIQVPDDDREDNPSPIVGYHYAELHDRIKEYLEDIGIIGTEMQPSRINEQGNRVKLFGLSIVNPENSRDGNESYVQIFTSLRDCIHFAYNCYTSIWNQLVDNGDIDERDSNDIHFLSEEEFELQFEEGDVCIQLSDYHIQFEFFENEINLTNAMYVSKTHDPVLSISDEIPKGDKVWICVYKDTLGFSDDYDNLTNILVPTEWLKNELIKEGQSLTNWFIEYTADNTDLISRKALSDGVIFDCSDEIIKKTLLNKAPSLNNLISNARKRIPSQTNSNKVSSKETEH